MLLIIINFVCCLVTMLLSICFYCVGPMFGCNDGTNQQIEKLIQSVLLFPILLSVLIDNINFQINVFFS